MARSSPKDWRRYYYTKRGLSIRPDRRGWSSNSFSFQQQDLRDSLGKKGAPKSISESIIDTNPYYSRDYREYSQNCQRCVVAYELQRRGYDVTARARYEGDKWQEIAQYDPSRGIYEGRWRGAFRGAKNVDVGAKGNNAKAEQQVINNITNQMKEWGNGARGVVQILYRTGGGHVFNVENQGGRVIWVEAQAGQLKDKFVKQGISGVKTESVRLVRTDNLRISDRAKYFVMPKKKKT